MKRVLGFIVVCIFVFAIVPIASAQPTPVTRMGDWVEIGNDTWMNIIATIDARYYTNHNADFEDNLRDQVSSSNIISGTNFVYGDNFEAEIRWGADFRYKKNLKMRVLLEAQSIYDGNTIDDRVNDQTTTRNSTHVERFWIDYTFPGTPLRLRVGSDLWRTDPAGLVADDDPRFALFANFGDVVLSTAIVIQEESERSRNPLTNDNDHIYYNFGIAYTGMKPHRLALDMTYFRWRADSNFLAGGNAGQKHDTVLIMPSYKGSFGPVSALLQPMGVFGTAERQTASPGSDYDVAAFGLIAYLDWNLGVVKPFLGLIYGTGDDNPTDGDLEGFHTLPQGEISLFNGGLFGFMTTSYSTGGRDTQAPARVGLQGGGGGQFAHVTGNPFNATPGGTAHAGIDSEYSNPGTLKIPVGLHVFPTKGHKITAAYIYNSFDDTGVIEPGLGVSIDETLYHELMLVWNWTLNKHFDIRLAGHIAIPGSGAEDIAETSFACGTLANEQCSGDDPALRASIRFRSRF